MNFLSLITLSLLMSGQMYAQPAPPQGKVWEVVPSLSDEFDVWNDSKWWKPLWNYGEPVMMLAQNSGVTNGNLWIKATLDNSSNRWFETSRVMSFTQISYPMYTECKMRTAHISAYNTFWMNNGDINNRDEIDMCENNSKPSIPSRQADWPFLMQSQYFITVATNDDRAKGNFDNRNLSPQNPLRGVKWNEDYHTIGVWWKDKNNMQFYLDGEPAGSVVTNRDFTRSLNIIWDLWTIDAPWSGGVAVKSDLSDDQINTMYVDWVHTYSLEDANLSVTDINAPKSVVYPNPVTDIVHVNLINQIVDDAVVRIYDNLGQLVKTEKLQGQDNQISINELSTGMYVARIFNGDLVDSKSIIKR
ncbi:T9SS type A sorting domain-containing protein [Aquimarina sp. RZ0]|uniref:T9SS type A sorting domain-containing protein n=1 Tax=Aquimarina sp. RZ0 TaxID=2607730 RepID=UPI0021059ACD|nr:T9SS type A sorting domain-containing protein [Aquimarina sp. RZ0]